MSIQLSGESMQNSDEFEYEYGFFKLENNHDKAIVRLMHENYDDFSRRPIHQVSHSDYKYGVAVNCLRRDSEPESVCPLCSCGLPYNKVSKRRKRLYIEFLVYKIMDKHNKVLQDFSKNPKRLVWERDRSFDDKVFSLSSRFNPLCDTVFQVERFGEKGSTDTSYDIYSIDVNPADYPFELPEKVYNPDNVQVLDKSFDELNYYIENGDFPPVDRVEEDNPPQNNQVARRADVRQQSSPVSENNSQQRAVRGVNNSQPIQRAEAPAAADNSAQPVAPSNPTQTTSRRRSI